MIGAFNLIAWSRVAPWSEQKQVEQDLLISRALVAIFGDPFLAGELRFRGGTALNKLHFPQALRYSEDVDLVRTSHGPIRPLLDALRAVLEPWLGKPTFEQSPVAPKLVFRAPAEDGGQLRLKVEINTRETEAFDSPLAIPFRVDNPWFSGQAQVATFSREEMLATKLRALLQRNKGRDLFDLSHALQVFEDLDTARVIDYLGRYLQHAGQRVSRAGRGAHVRQAAHRQPARRHARAAAAALRSGTHRRGQEGGVRQRIHAVHRVPAGRAMGTIRGDDRPLRSAARDPCRLAALDERHDALVQPRKADGLNLFASIRDAGFAAEETLRGGGR